MSARIATGVTVPEAARLVAEVRRWRQSFEVVPGVHTPGEADPLPLLRRLDLAPRMDGLRVLEAGCRDGFFAFEIEHRGARVSAAHLGAPSDGFLLARELRHSRVTSVPGEIYDLGEEAGGPFDLVLCLGLLEDLRHPLLALDTLAGLVRPGGMLLVETAVIGHGLAEPAGRDRRTADGGLPLMRFSPAPRPGGGWAPTVTCLESMVASARFLVRGATVWTPGRALVRAVRMRDPVPVAEPLAHGLRLVGAGPERTGPGDRGGEVLEMPGGAPHRPGVDPVEV